MNLSWRQKVLQVTYPVIQLINDLHAPWSHKKIKEKHVHDLLEIVRPGDIFVTRTGGELTNVLIPGYYKHSGIFVGGSGHPRLVEAVDAGVILSGIYDFMLTRDYVQVYRSIQNTKYQASVAATEARNLVGSAYDYDFILEDRNAPNKKFYCSELCYVSHKKANPALAFQLRDIWGARTIAPDDFTKAKTHWRLVWDSKDV